MTQMHYSSLVTVFGCTWLGMRNHWGEAFMLPLGQPPPHLPPPPSNITVAVTYCHCHWPMLSLLDVVPSCHAHKHRLVACEQPCLRSCRRVHWCSERGVDLLHIAQLLWAVWVWPHGGWSVACLAAWGECLIRSSSPVEIVHCDIICYVTNAMQCNAMQHHWLPRSIADTPEQVCMWISHAFLTTHCVDGWFCHQWAAADAKLWIRYRECCSRWQRTSWLLHVIAACDCRQMQSLICSRQVAD